MSTFCPESGRMKNDSNIRVRTAETPGKPEAGRGLSVRNAWHA